MDTRFHESAVSQRVKSVLGRLAPLLTPMGFYLVEPMPMLEAIQRAGVAFEVVRIAPETLIGRSSGVQVSLFGYPYPLLEQTFEWKDCSVRIASKADLLCMKLTAIVQRGAKRDFIDLYQLLHDFSLAEALQLFERKYGFVESASIARALTYFEDADTDPAPRMLKPLRWRAVKQFFHQQVRALWE